MRTIGQQQQQGLDRMIEQELGIPVRVLMEYAGMAVAREAMRMLAGCSERLGVHIVCGHGQNAGDALVAARLLQSEGHSVVCYLDGAPPGTAEMAAQLNTVRALRIPCQDLKDLPAQASLIIDGLFGTGFKTGRPLPVPVADCILQMKKARQAGARVLSVDIPSGLEADTSRHADLVVEADRTVTFLFPKTGLVGDPGRSLAGTIVVDRLGLAETVLSRLLEQIEPHPGVCEWTDPEQIRRLAISRPAGLHKGQAGRALLIAGSPGFGGAALLASEAALRSGIGLLNLLTDRSQITSILARLPEVMVTGLEGDQDPLADTRLNQLLEKNPSAVAIGPGIGLSAQSASLLASVVDAARSLVIDADALTLMASDWDRFLPLLLSRPSRGCQPAILTPHPGEFRRLMPDAASLPRLEAARLLAEKTQAVILLKGASTVIASLEGKAHINPTGNDGLARGGSGDVLTGLILGLLAQGLSAFEAACCGAYLHGLAADLAASRTLSRTLLPSDVIRLLPDAFREAGWT